MKNKIITLILAFVLCLPLFSCGEEKEPIEWQSWSSGDSAVINSAEALESIPPDTEDRITVCLDYGHGFKDVGCYTPLSEKYVCEKEITPVLGGKIKKALEERGVTVFLTNDGVAFPGNGFLLSEAKKLGIEYDETEFEDNYNFTKNERALYTEILHRTVGLDLFISIHVNYVEASPEKVLGTTLSYCVENPHAKNLQSFSDIFKKIGLNRDVCSKYRCYADPAEDSLYVTRETTAPAVLIEAAYASNEKDIKRIDSEEWQDAFADALADSVIEYMNETRG